MSNFILQQNDTIVIISENQKVTLEGGYITVTGLSAVFAISAGDVYLKNHLGDVLHHWGMVEKAVPQSVVDNTPPPTKAPELLYGKNESRFILAGDGSLYRLDPHIQVDINRLDMYMVVSKRMHFRCLPIECVEARWVEADDRQIVEIGRILGMDFIIPSNKAVVSDDNLSFYQRRGVWVVG